VVDAVRIKEQIIAIREAYPTSVAHVHLTAPLDVLEERYKQRPHPKGTTPPPYSKVRENLTELNVDKLRDIADIVINTDRCRPGDVLVRAAARLSMYGSSKGGNVDVIIGGEFGSEGKGQIVAYLAKEYDLLVRVGGPNAGHKIFEKDGPYTHHHLPSGTRKSNAGLLLAPGMVINVEKLLEEVAECRVDSERLSIDPQIMVISPEDVANEARVVKAIGSTGQGVGEATARKIKDRGERGPKKVKLAKDIPQLKPYIRPAEKVLTEAFSKNQRILVEGTQGTGLSLYHGYYPYVTSRDTCVAGCLAEAGIPPSRVRRVIMVCRTYPIRVESPERGTSGPMWAEIPLEEVSLRSKISLTELRKIERTSTTNRKRRIGEFDWVLLRKAAALNGPTDIALTFTDYISKKNRKAVRFDQLTTETINFIEEVERVSGASVSLITTGFNLHSVIDRRKW
jgi:adenylosuccinate synthase